MRYQILGPARALRDDGTAVPLGGPRLRAALSVLALRPGRAVPVSVFVDEVWGEADVPPADAPAAAQALIARLRRALGRDAVAFLHGGYALAADPDDVDLHRFERLTSEGVQALAGGDPAKAVALLDDALALWQSESGPALADLPALTADAARWQARRLDARRARLAGAIALGRSSEVLPELTALCAEHPLDEPLQALRLRALHATGRTAEALDAYEGVRRELADRLGIDPSAELRALHRELLETPAVPAPVPALVPALVPPPPPPPAPVAAPPPPPPPAPVAAPARTGAPTGNLRARLTSFVGREADIQVIRGDLSRARLVTLLGPGGAGKTRLSQETAELADAAPWPDGAWMAELAPVDDPDAVADAVLTALGARQTVLRGAGAESVRVAEPHTGDPLVRLTEHCARRRMLLLLDNCEHLIDAAARLAEHLLAHCPGLTILATSREPLGVPGELVRPVDPLPEAVSLRLLAERGAAARPGFRIDDDPEAAAEICRRLDGLPLAIELAAARLRMLTPRQIADRLDDRFRLLTGGARTVLPRQQTLRAVVDWSWGLLEAEERQVLAALSVFSGGCDLAAAEAVCGPTALDLLGSLVDKSLVVAAPVEGHGGSDGGMRYRLLETVSEYAAERLTESGARPAAERRHLVHFRELARTGEPLLRGHEQLRWMHRFQDEYENLRTALRRAVAARDEHEVLVLVHSLAWFWQVRDLRGDARHWTEAAMGMSEDPFGGEGPVTPAAPVFARCVDAPPPMSPDVLEEARRGARILNLVSMNHRAGTWFSPEAKKWLARIVATYTPGLPQACRMPGSLWVMALLMTTERGEPLREAIDLTVEACRGYGYAWELAAALEMRANIFANHSAWAGDARRDAEESLEIFVRLGDAYGAAEALSARGEAYERIGEYDRAAEAYRSAIDYVAKLDARGQIMLLRSRLSGALIASGDEVGGAEGEAMLRSVLDDPEGPGLEATPSARLTLGIRLARTGRLREARAEFSLLSDDFDNGNLMIFDGFSLGLLAWVANLDASYAEGLVLGARALDRSQDPLSMLIAPQMPAVHLMTVAGSLAGLAAAEAGPPAAAESASAPAGSGAGASLAADAARLLGAYEAHLPEGHFVDRQETESRDTAIRLTRTFLDDASYGRAYAEGGGLSVKEAAALVHTRRDAYGKEEQD